MEHVCSLKKDECLLIDPNKEIKGQEILNSNHEEDEEEEPPLFLGFPSPFFDEISSTTPLLINSTHTNQHHLICSQNKPLKYITDHHEPSSKSKRIKKTTLGKKDRHSKIHTAQGLRDRRMRLSLDIARKFFDLQDLLGFEKASNTIEWLFSKSNKAIKEVVQNFNNPQQHTNQTLSQEMDSLISQCEAAATNKLENTKEDIQNRESKRRVHNNYLAKETRDQARARARDRTRERRMIKEFEKSKQLFEGNPKDEIYKLGIGYEAMPNNYNIVEKEKLGYTSSPSQHNIQQEASSPSVEHATSHHLLREHLQLANINVDSFENYSGSIVGASTYLINHNVTPAGWQNSSDGFFGIPEEWDADNFYNYGMEPNNGHLTGDIYEQNPSSFFMSITTNILHLQSQNQGK